MRLLLTGKHGQVGFELQRALAPLGEVIALDRNECDLSNTNAIRSLVHTIRPDAIVNPAAYTAVDKAESERDLAFAVNATAPRVFGEEAAKLGALVVHYSTDYVFNGRKEGFYTEADATDPQSVYGASKLAGEEALLQSGAPHLILRTSWVAGAHGHNFAKTMLRLAMERDRLAIVADQYGAPTSAALIADVTAHLIRQSIGKRQDSFSSGVYHLAAGGVTNWHEYACHVIKMARAAGKPIKVAPDMIEPITTVAYPTPAKRPANSRLDTSKLRQTFGLNLPDWRTGIDHILQQIL